MTTLNGNTFTKKMLSQATTDTQRHQLLLKIVKHNITIEPKNSTFFKKTEAYKNLNMLFFILNQTSQSVKNAYDLFEKTTKFRKLLSPDLKKLSTYNDIMTFLEVISKYYEGILELKIETTWSVDPLRLHDKIRDLRNDISNIKTTIGFMEDLFKNYEFIINDKLAEQLLTLRFFNYGKHE